MFGTLRYILIILIVFEHLAIKFYGSSPGIFAMVVFILLSGFSMQHKFIQYEGLNKKGIILFWIDRIIRIYPEYFFVLIITVLFITSTDFGSPVFRLKAIISNIFIIPLNYYMLINTKVLTFPSERLIPTGWALGLILQYYILAPFVFKHKFRFIAAIISFIVFFLAFLGILNTNLFGYRLLPGTLFIFLCGAFLYASKSDRMKNNEKKEEAFFNFYAILFIWVISLTLLLIILFFNKYDFDFSFEVLLGVLIGLPLIQIFSIINIKSSFDNFLGSISYGVFLCHYLSIWIIKYFDLSFINDNKYIYTLTIILLSSFLAYTSNSIMKPFESFRKNFNFYHRGKTGSLVTK